MLDGLLHGLTFRKFRLLELLQTTQYSWSCATNTFQRIAPAELARPCEQPGQLSSII